MIYISKNGLFRPLGGITITSATKGTETPSSTYEQDISRAEVRANVTLSGVPITMRTWTSATENLIVTEITNNSSSPVDLRADLWISRSPASQHGRTNPPASFISKAGADKNLLGEPGTPAHHAAGGLDTVAKTAIATAILGAEKLSVSGAEGMHSAPSLCRPNRPFSLRVMWTEPSVSLLPCRASRPSGTEPSPRQVNLTKLESRPLIRAIFSGGGFLVEVQCRAQ